MIQGIQFWLVAATALSAGLMGGVFYAFSTFVMRGLKRLSPENGITAMQSINVTAVGPGLMIPFIGTGIASVAVVVWAIADWDPTVSSWLLAGAASYLLGTFVMTAAYHVPRNDALAETSPEASSARAAWSRYLSEWTRWNHLRSASSLGAATALSVALLIS
jgi:uncharacterized membrane protein